MLLTLVSLAGWAGNVIITPHVINVYYPAPKSVADVEVTAEHFDLSGDINALIGEGDDKFADMAAAKESLLNNLQVTIVQGYQMPVVTGSAKYYFSVLGEGLNAKWNGTTFTMAYNGDLNVLPRDLATVNFFSDPEGANYAATNSYKYTYDGTAKTPEPVVYVGADPTKNNLVKGTDFAFEYIHNTDANGVNIGTELNPNTTPKIKIVPATNTGYTGYKTLDFTINPKDFGDDVTIDDISGAVYNKGAAVTPDLTVTDAAINNKTLVKDVDYEIAEGGWANNFNAALATAENAPRVTIKGIGNYTTTSEKTKTFTIAKKNISSTDITWSDVIPQLNYPVAANAQDGASLKWGEAPLPEGIDISFPAVTGIGSVTLTASVTANSQADANYIGTKTTTFEVIPGFIDEDVTITFEKPAPTQQNPNATVAATYVYNGGKIKPGTDDDYLVVKKGDLTLVKGTDYVILDYENNTNAALATAEKAPTVIIKGIGNFDAVDANSKPRTKSGKFTIGQRPIVVTAKSVTKVYSKADIPFESEIDVVAADKANLLLNDVTYSVKKMGGAAPVAIDENAYAGLDATTTQDVQNNRWTFTEETITKWYQIVPALTWDNDLTDNPELTEDQIAAINATRANYKLDAGQIIYEEGNLKVERASYIIAVKSRSKIYGSTTEPGTYGHDGNVIASRFDNTKAVDAQETYYTYEVIKVEGETETVVNDVVPNTTPKIGRKLAANQAALPEDVKEGGYTIEVLNVDANGKFLDPNYDFTLRSGILTIEPFKLILTANNQTIEYGAQPNTVASAETVTFSPAMTGKGLISREELDLQLTVSKAFDGTIKTHQGVLIPSLGATVKNYTIDANETVKGNITVTAADELLLWDGDEDVLAKINDYDTKTLNVKIKIDQRDRNLGGKARTWADNSWNTMTLPFDITVKELSQILGYAVVNVVDAKGYSESESGAPVYKFNLTMKGGYGEDFLPANKPFVIKTTDALADFDVDDDGYIDFGERKIIAPTAADFAGVDAGGNSTFKPAYAKREVSKADEGKIWFQLGNYAKWAYIKSSSTATWNIVPFEGFIDQNNTTAENPEAAIFLMEDIDGTVTAIKGVEVDNVNGQKNVEGMYNLNGMKLNSVPTQKGVYIQNGKKVIIK